jgi:hypothetical protein
VYFIDSATFNTTIDHLSELITFKNVSCFWPLIVKLGEIICRKLILVGDLVVFYYLGASEIWWFLAGMSIQRGDYRIAN